MYIIVYHGRVCNYALSLEREREDTSTYAI